MSHPAPVRFPVSTRHAFGLALDLAVRRDPLHSLVVPWLLRAPWILAVTFLPPIDETDRLGRVMLVGSVALLGDYLALMLTSAMLRFRARSVFGAPLTTRPAPALECYALGLRRVPWLVVTEFVRYFASGLGLFFFLVPGVFLGFRLSFAAEAVTLTEPHLSRAFQRSFGLTARRFERWFELTMVSVLPVLAVWFVIALRSLLGPVPLPTAWFTTAWLLFAAWTPIVLYAWTFFYLRLVEIEGPGIEVGPTYAGMMEPPAVPAGSATAALPERGEPTAAAWSDSGATAGEASEPEPGEGQPELSGPTAPLPGTEEAGLPGQAADRPRAPKPTAGEAVAGDPGSGDQLQLVLAEPGAMPAVPGNEPKT